MTTRAVRYDVVDHVAVMTLDRPDRLNAFTDQMEGDLLECFDRSDADPDVRAVVITGAGRAFCAGMDLAEAAPDETFERWRTSPDAPSGTQFDVPGESMPIRLDGGGRVTLRIFDSLHPVVAAINGHAIGVGITMTLAADVRLAATGAKVAFPFTQRGFAPESCSSWFLPRLVGISQALEWMLAGRTFDSEEGQDRGLFRSLHAPEDVLPAAMQLARSLAAGTAPVSVSLTRRMLWHMLTVAHPAETHEFETLVLNRRGVSKDAHEGVAAFLEKRAPVFATNPTAPEAELLAQLGTPTVDLPGAIRRP